MLSPLITQILSFVPCALTQSQDKSLMLSNVTIMSARTVGRNTSNIMLLALRIFSSGNVLSKAAT